MRLLGGALVVGGLLTLCYLGLFRRRRPGRIGGRLAAPPAPPHDLDLSEAIEGVYVATTTAYDWSERISAHGLDVRSRAVTIVDLDGVAVLRSAAPSFFIPADELLAVRMARGAEAGGLVVFTWQHDGHRLDTGFRPRLAADAKRLVELGTDLTDSVAATPVDAPVDAPDDEPHHANDDEPHYANGDNR